MDLDKKMTISDPSLAHPKENPEQPVKWQPSAGSALQRALFKCGEGEFTQ